MNRAITIMLAAILLLCCVSCTPHDASTDPGSTDPAVIEPSQGAPETTDEAPPTAPSAAPIEEYPLPNDPEALGDCVKDAELIALLPIGEAENSISFIPSHDNYEDDEGPNAFALSNGKVYVLDLMNGRIAVFEEGDLGFIPFSDKDTHDYYTSMAIVGSSIYLVGTTAGESQVAVYDMSGERTGSIPMPEGTNGAYALYEENGVLVLLTHDLEAFRLTDGSFVKQSSFTATTPVVNGKITASFNGVNIELDAGECTALGIYRNVQDRIYCIGFGDQASYRVYGLNGELLGASTVAGSDSIYYPVSPMFVSPDGELYVMTCTNDGVYITKPHLRK